MKRKFLTAPVSPDVYRQTRLAAATLDMSIAEFIRRSVKKSCQEILADTTSDVKEGQGGRD